MLLWINFAERKNWIFDQVLTDLFIVLPSGDGSTLYRTNWDFETWIPQSIGGSGIEYILVLGFFAVWLLSKRACILSYLATDILQ